VLLGTFGLLMAGPSVEPPSDVVVDFARPSLGLAQIVDFDFGSNELYDLFVDGGVERARELGIDRVRVWLGHRFLGAAVRSTAEFDLDWELLLGFVQRVLDAGAVPSISFVAAPAWVTAIDGRPSSHHESEKFGNDGVQAYGAYVAEAIDRLRGRFGEQIYDWFYVIWNEPNNWQNAGARYACGDGATYLPLVAEARRAVDARMGAGRIRLGGPSIDAIDTGASLDANGQRRCGNAVDLDWEAYLSAVDTRVPLDFLTWHWYGMFRIGETTPQDVLLTRLTWFEDRVARITRMANGRPHIVEEININGDLAADPLINEQINAAFLASASLRAVRQGAAGLFVYKGTRHPSGRSPDGEPDFGLWTSDPAQPATPAYHALRLLRRALTDGDRIVRTEVAAPDVDALALQGSRGRTLIVVNLSEAPRVVRIQGVSAGPYVVTDAGSAWDQGWFDGRTLTLQPHAVAVVTAESNGLADLPSVAAGRELFAFSQRGPSCMACHGVEGGGGAAPALAGVDRALLSASHAASSTSSLERTDLSAYLRGVGGPPQRYTGVVRDTQGGPVAGALVIAVAGDSGRVTSTDADGRFNLLAPTGDAAPEAAAPRFTVVHPDYRAARQPLTRVPLAPHATEISFKLAPAPDVDRPLLAVAHLVRSGLPGLWTVGVATAGEGLTVWAIDDLAQAAIRLLPVAGHPYGLHRADYSSTDPSPGDRPWRLVAISPDGVTSRVVSIEAPAQG
jgi:mono/diheme cytochrome c family protein